MGLSRLDNFLKSAKGAIIYVDPNNIDATDSIDNKGNSPARPFRSIQRALIESARFSYQRGLNNDRFNKTTVLLYPGDHIVDNRPGLIPTGSGTFTSRNGSTVETLPPWDLDTNLDLSTADNQLYKLNSIHGGVIVPRGTSIVGMDLRKTKVRPRYVPNPENSNIERSCVFRVTGGCYFWQFTILDADPNGICYRDYTTNTATPNFSHHKLSGFEYADGVNDVNIQDGFLTYSASRTDLDMYYEKVSRVYGPTSDREVQPDFGDGTVDLQPVVDEYRIVGSRGASVGISSIKAGGGTVPTATTTITVDLESALEGINVDTPIQIIGVADGYDGQYVVRSVSGTTQLTYEVQNVPSNPLPSTSGSTLRISVDTVTSASPYIFNISLRSVYGMCGLLADGDKADGFKSMVVAQYTGIGLQKDDKAFTKYNSTTGTYQYSNEITDLHTDSLAKFKPSYENFHIKATNDAYLQLVSVFAIGYAQHFVVESGGDFSINNSNSNFGAKALQAVGFRREAFPRDDVGYISHIITPQEIEIPESTVGFLPLDVGITTSVGISSHLFIYGAKNVSDAPSVVLDGYRLGAKTNERLHVQISQSGVSTEYYSRVVMPSGAYDTTQYSSEKIAFVGRSNSGPTGINSISTNTLTFTGPHPFINGESIRIISENGHLPDGLENNQIYYAIVSAGIGTDKIKIAKTLNESLVGTSITLNTKGGDLRVVSRVSDKNPGDIGHPIQFNTSVNQWYTNVSVASTENEIYNKINQLGVAGIGTATSKTYIRRKSNTRSLADSIYKVRYVIPKDSVTTARPPIDGYVIQESGNIIGIGTAEIQKYFSDSSATLSNSDELRNPRFIANATWSSSTASVTTELPHNLSVGSQVEVINVTSTNNPTGIANSAFNGTHTVTGISSTKTFTYSLTSNPGTFTNDTSSRTTSLPRFKKKRFSGTYYIYRTEEIQPYIKDSQDGIYHLIILNSSNSPTITPFSDQRFSQPILNLYPQVNRDNLASDPEPTKSFATPNIIGKVVVNDPQNSVTKETSRKQIVDFGVGVGLTDVVSASSTSHTLYTSIDHGLCGITSVSIINGGSSYTQGVYYNTRLVSIGASTTGQNATAKVVVGASGTVTSITIMDGGSAYGIGNTLSVTGIGTLGSGAQVQVTHINNHVDHSLVLSGITSSTYSSYNTSYKIGSITTGKAKEISVISLSPISTYTTSGIGATHTSLSHLQLTDKVRNISSIVYDNTVGLATITFAESHPYRVGNKINIRNSSSSLYNGDFVVKQVVGLNTCVVNVGISTSVPSTSYPLNGYLNGLTSYGGELNSVNENVSGRLFATFAGITTTLGADISSTAIDTTPIAISSPELLGLKIGDYLQIDDEILRIKQTVSGSSVYVFRGVLGTRRQDHVSGAVIRKINVQPVELRRNSIIRASAHTFEYLGFGPGNYSTSFPERQDRVVSSQEQLLAQSTKLDGGISIFTGMNDRGDFYSGNKRINASTGQEEVFDSPIPTTTGEDISVNAGVNIGFDVISPLELNVNRAIRIDGGVDNNIVSELKGPVVFSNKITSTSEKGIEVNNLLIKGDGIVSKKHTVGLGTPTQAGTPGDVVYHPSPTQGGYLGWVYTANNVWEPFGKIATNGTF